MFEGFVGPKGGGKSYGLTEILFNELRQSERPIFTNNQMFHDKQYMCYLQQACDERIGHKTVNVVDRVFELTAKDLCRFWCFCKAGEITETQEIPQPGGKTLVVPDFSKRRGDGGILYIIDEAHIPFSSYNWAAVAKEALFYCTQERKFGDDTIFASQVPGQMAKPLRELISNWVETTNRDMVPIMGCRFPGWFTWRWTFRQPGTAGAEQAYRKQRVKMDPLLCKCYDTLAGVGVVGKGKPERKAKWGLKWQWWLATAICLVVLLCAVSYAVVTVGVAKGRQAVVSALGISVPERPKVDPVPASPDWVSNAVHGLPQRAAAVETLPAPVTFKNGETTRIDGNKVVAGEVKVVGWTSSNRRGVKVILSDGRTITSGDARLRYIGREGVLYDGEFIRFDKGATLPVVPVPIPPELPPVNLSGSVVVGKEVKGSAR